MGKIKRKRIGYTDTTKATMNMYYYLYKSTAKNKEIPFRISKKLFKKLVKSKCSYCGMVPSNPINGYLNKDGTRRGTGSTTISRAEKATLLVNGIDRIHNESGYYPWNVTTACKACNSAKSAKSLSDFELWISRLMCFRISGGHI